MSLFEKIPKTQETKSALEKYKKEYRSAKRAAKNNPNKNETRLDLKSDLAVLASFFSPWFKKG